MVIQSGVDLASAQHVRASVFIYRKELAMWWGLGAFGIFLYFVLLIFLGLSCLRKGHWVMFILGIFLPIFWLIGALIQPVNPQTA